ncbi:MAG TPA: VWA domain-containing protein [Anaerolineales bacterium]|nr:VWA domain-containing protein [Anaerolineales bacterium]
MSSRQFDNHYARLGVPFDATQREIRRAYHGAAKRHHPDANQSTEATDQFLRVQMAFDILSDPETRAIYDQSLEILDDQAGLAVSTVMNRKTIPAAQESQLFYAMVTLQPVAPEKNEGTPPINVCLVVDTSTSMKGQRMDMVKITARRILRQLRPGDVFSIVTFSDRAEVIIEAAKDRDLNKTEARISQIQAAGGTEIYHGLRIGYEQILRYHRAANINHLVLVTDGHTYGDEDKCLALAEKIRQSGITISALGLGNQWNEKFLDRLASLTGGSSMFIAYARDIKQFLEQKFDDLHKIFAENIRLDLDPSSPEVSINYIFRMQPEPTRLEPQQSTTLGNLGASETLVLLLEFMIEPTGMIDEPLRIISGEIRYEIAGRVIPAGRAHLSIDLPIKSETLPEFPPPEIVRAMSRLTLYRMQESARTDLEAGNYEAATRRLRHMATHVLAAGDHELGSTILTEAARLESGAHRTRSLGKAVMYGTKSLLPLVEPQADPDRKK